MAGLELLQSVEFLKLKGKQVAVLDVENWQAFIEWLESVEDLQIAKQALNELKAAGRNRDRAGWLKWDDVESQLD
ncbi:MULTISPECIES: hypothetical protein [unclassified Microcoleus]|uniref:hypothetical protein n=1 Tax=unclassified Microcoleus TaxID=2642155 RepID=UPI002FD3C622